MALMQLLFGKSNRKGFCLPEDEGGTDTVSLELDVISSENPSYTAVPTKTQVESGADVTDHVALDPIKLSIEATVSNTPVGWDKLLTGALFDDRAQAGHEFILNLYNGREPFGFIGSLGVYENMIITKYAPVKDSKTGNVLQFTADLEQINIVESALVETAGGKYADGVKHAAAKTENQGMQATQEASEKSKTLLARLNDNYKFLPGLVR